MVEHSAVNRQVGGSSPLRGAIYGWIAQSVEQRTENPRVPGSIPGPATNYFWRHGQVVRQRPAKPLSPVQIRVAPPKASDFISDAFYFYLENIKRQLF